VPFGLRLVAPLWRARLELSSGGGLYDKYSVSNGNQSPFGPIRSLDGWGGYFMGGAAVALDRGRHWWLGASPLVFWRTPRSSSMTAGS
jgi:hypothetical protein